MVGPATVGVCMFTVCAVCFVSGIWFGEDSRHHTHRKHTGHSWSLWHSSGHHTRYKLVELTIISCKGQIKFAPPLICKVFNSIKAHVVQTEILIQKSEWVRSHSPDVKIIKMICDTLVSVADGCLDFGTIKVFEEAKQSLRLKNQGKYEIAYK